MKTLKFQEESPGSVVIVICEQLSACAEDYIYQSAT